MNSIAYMNRNDRYITENISDDILFSKLTIAEKSINATIKDLSVNGLFLQLDNDLNFEHLDKIENLKIIYNEELLYEGVAKIIYQMDNENNPSTNFGVQLLSESTDRIEYFLKHELTKLNERKIDKKAKLLKKPHIRKEFLFHINNLASYLSSIKEELNRIDEKLMDITFDKREQYHKFVINEYLDEFRKFHNEIYKKLNDIYFDIHPKQRKFYKDYAINKVRKYYIGSPFCKRAVDKPLGYSGDFIQILMMFEDNIGSNLSLFDRLAHKFLMVLDPCIAHRNRIDYLYNILKSHSIYKQTQNEKFTFLSLGCGPAIEVQKFAKSIYSNNSKGILVDMDSRCLDFCKKTLNNTIKSSGSHLDIEYIHFYVKQISELEITHNKCDIIYCAGLFDYLNDEFSSYILQRLYKKLNKNGKLIFTNVIDNRYFFLVDVMGDWLLRIRNNDDFIRICNFVSEDKITIKTDETKSNAYIEIKK